MQKTFVPNPTHYTRDEFRKLISSIQLGRGVLNFPLSITLLFHLLHNGRGMDQRLKSVGAQT